MREGTSGERTLDVALQIAQISLALPIVVTYGLVQFKRNASGPAELPAHEHARGRRACRDGAPGISAGFVITNVLWVVVSATGLRALALKRGARVE
jgi:hypothetical protein